MAHRMAILYKSWREVLQFGGAAGGVGFSYPVFEALVWNVGVVFACAFLSR